MRVAFAAGLALALGACASSTPHRDARLHGDALDREVEQHIAAAHVPGLALAVIEHGEITHLRAYGKRDVERGLPLTTDTVMYAASLTKALFAYAVMTLVDDGRLDLDRPIAATLPKPLPDYPKYADLADDMRWRRITPRMLLDHTAGFPNFRFWTRDGRYDEHGKLAIEFDPGTRFAYSGEGINLLQFVIENGLGIDVDTLIRTRVFDRFGMRASSMTWRDAFAANLAIGYDEAGKPLGHKQRGGVRAAGSMDTTLGDYAKFLAGLVRCDGLSRRSCDEMRRMQVRIDSVQQFPTLSTETTHDNDSIALGYGLGVAVYRAPSGPAFFKSGHDDGTNNLALCLVASESCVLILSNSSNGESTFTHIVEAALGATCLPWYWENYLPYDAPGLRDPAQRAASHVPCAPPR
ncbi:MAG: serine hydrolase domain-containing protein [Rhodanobacteraceae bacterium]